jgi:tellurite resistance protein
MATKTYIVAENWGKGFIEHSESAKFTISGFPGNVWQVPAHNKDANLWIAKVLGTVKTKDEAQAIVDAGVQVAQATYDALPAEEKATRQRPDNIVLVE